MRDNERFIIDLNKKRETAWQQLYEEFYPALCTYVAKLTHENVGVEDIVQECMIGLWDSSLQFPNVKSLAGWLYKAVYNRALNMSAIGKLYFRDFLYRRNGYRFGH